MSRICVFLLFISLVFAEDLAVTQEYTDFLKKHVSWQVADYEENIFKGWTIDEVKSILQQEELPDMQGEQIYVRPGTVFPDSLNWKELKANCIHEIKNQGNCGSCWAFSATGVVSDRCCLHQADHGWLAPQELVSCDHKNSGCNGGWEFNALDYVAANGLVPDACFPYKATNVPCPSKCADGSDWKKAHVCKCKAKVFCQGPDAMKACLQTGPVTAGMYVYQDFISYKSGIYHWNKTGNRLGGHAIRCYGYSETPEAHWICANSWGTVWGEQGSFRIGKGEVGIDTRNPSYCDPAN